MFWLLALAGVCVYFVVLWGVLRTTVGVFRYHREVDESTLHEATRIVRCPDNRQRVSVRTGTTDGELHITDCCRWPEKRDCDQECVAEVSSRPEQSLVRNILRDWYVNQPCAFCGKKLVEQGWFDLKPLLLSPTADLRRWHDFPTEDLPDVLPHHRPVCTACGRVSQNLYTA